MGRAGPAPTPTKLRVLHGDGPKRINKDEPPTPPGPPECPDDASDDVRQVWEYTMANLLVMGVATPCDADALRVYCEAVVTHRKACALLAKSPIVIPHKGSVMQNPAIQVQRDSATTIRMYSREFGFTPAARSEIQRGAASHYGPEASRYLNA